MTTVDLTEGNVVPRQRGKTEAAQTFCESLGLTPAHIERIMHDTSLMQRLRECIRGGDVVLTHEAMLMLGPNCINVAEGDQLRFPFSSHDKVHLSQIPISSDQLSKCCQTHILVAVPACSLLEMLQTADPQHYEDEIRELRDECFARQNGEAEWWLISRRLTPAHTENLQGEMVVPARVAFYAFYMCVRIRHAHLLSTQGYSGDRLDDGRFVALESISKIPTLSFKSLRQDRGLIVGRKLERHLP